MAITKREDVTKQGSCKILSRKLQLRGSILLVLVLIQFWGAGVGVVAYLSLSGRRVGWVLIRGWALIIRRGAYSNKYGMTVDPNISLYTLCSRTLGSQLLENSERRCYIKVTGEEGSS